MDTDRSNPEAKRLVLDYIEEERRRHKRAYWKVIGGLVLANLAVLIAVIAGLYRLVERRIEDKVTAAANNLVEDQANTFRKVSLINTNFFQCIL